MSKSARNFKLHGYPDEPIMRCALIAALAGIAVFAAGASALAQAPSQEQALAKGKIPELASAQFAWLALGVDWLDPPPGLGRGPIKAGPRLSLPWQPGRRGQVTPHIGNAKDPVLKPWAAKQMQESNDEVLTGKRGLPFSAQSSCYPGGVPEQLLTPAQPFYFIQTPNQVWMIWETDHMVRRIYMTDQHSEIVKPSWFGESIGHYEDGDTLVVDTIGLQAHNSYLDWFRTPHTEKLHVVERFKLSADGKTLEVLVKVDDPDTFNEPLYMVRRWSKVPNQRLEMVCAENNGDHFGKNLFPIPQRRQTGFLVFPMDTAQHDRTSSAGGHAIVEDRTGEAPKARPSPLRLARQRREHRRRHAPLRGRLIGRGRLQRQMLHAGLDQEVDRERQAGRRNRRRHRAGDAAVDLAAVGVGRELERSDRRRSARSRPGSESR